MIRHPFLGRVALAAGFFLCAYQVQAVTLLYEPFNYTEGNFLAATPEATPNSPTSPIGYLAPNFNNWYGTGIAGSYQAVNDGQVSSADLSITGLAHTAGTKSLTVGGTGNTMRLSLNTSTQAQPNRTTPNSTDTADPLAGTDGTLQPTDTAHTGYYSILLRVGSLVNLAPAGGTLLGFNNIIGAQEPNPTTVGAALTIRPKATAGQFELGILKNSSGTPTNATWDTTNTYTINSTILVVGKYQTVGPLQSVAPGGIDDVASLWINPAAITFGGFEPAGALVSTGATGGDDMPTNAGSNNHTLQSFVLRQANLASGLPSSITYDDLRVGTNWADVTPVAPVSVPGDFNGNGKVDAGDYVLWRNGGPLANEVTGVGTVNDADYTDWRARFGNPAGSGGGSGSTVPEPAAVSLAMMVASLFSVRRKNRR